MLKRTVIVFLTLIIILTGCNQMNDNSISQNEISKSDIDESETGIIDEDVKKELLKVIEEYQFLGSGSNFLNPYDGDYEKFLFYSLYKAQNLNNINNYYKENVSTDNFKQVSGYIIPRLMVSEILDICFGICEFRHYSPNYYYDYNNYFFPNGGMGYIVEHKIRNIEILSDGRYKVVVDGYYPEEEIPSAIPKEYVIKPYTLAFEPNFWGELYKKGDTIYKILSVSDYFDGTLKNDAIKFDNPFEIEVLDYEFKNFYVNNDKKGIYVPQKIKSGNGFSFYDVMDKLGMFKIRDYFSYTINLSPDSSELILSIFQTDELKEQEYLQERLEADIKSICETFRRNISSLKTIKVLFDNGEPYKPNGNREVELEIDEKGIYKFDNLVFPTKTKEELKQLSETIPLNFEKFDSEFMKVNKLYLNYADDEEKVEIADFLQGVFGTSYDRISFENKEQIPQRFLISVATNIVPYVEWGGDDELQPFSETCFDDMGILKVHAEKAIKEIFCENVEFKPREELFDAWKYDEYAEIITPPHMSISIVVPAILDMQENGDGYIVTTSFLSMSYDGLCYKDKKLEPKTAIDYLRQNAVKYEISLERGGEFGFRIESVEKIYS